MSQAQTGRIRRMVDLIGFRAAVRTCGEAAVSRAMPARVHHRRHVRKLKPWLVEEAQRRALLATLNDIGRGDKHISEIVGAP